jgi:hypothetical protein
VTTDELAVWFLKACSAQQTQGTHTVNLTSSMMDYIAVLGAPRSRRVPNKLGMTAQTRGPHRPRRPPHHSQWRRSSPLWHICERVGKRQVRHHGQRRLASAQKELKARSAIRKVKMGDIPPESLPSSHLPPSPCCVSCVAHWELDASDRVCLHLIVLQLRQTLASGTMTRA